MTVFQFPESTFNFDLTPFGKQNQTLDDISFNTENNILYNLFDLFVLFIKIL